MCVYTCLYSSCVWHVDRSAPPLTSPSCQSIGLSDFQWGLRRHRTVVVLGNGGAGRADKAFFFFFLNDKSQHFCSAEEKRTGCGWGLVVYPSTSPLLLCSFLKCCRLSVQQSGTWNKDAQQERQLNTELAGASQGTGWDHRWMIWSNFRHRQRAIGTAWKGKGGEGQREGWREGERGRRGQKWGQIYFLCAVALDDGPLWGHRGL